MKTSKFTDEQVAMALRQAEAGTPGLLLCGAGWSATTTVAETARMDNLLAVQT